MQVTKDKIVLQVTDSIDTPVSGKASLTVSTNGNLVITDDSGQSSTINDGILLYATSITSLTTDEAGKVVYVTGGPIVMNQTPQDGEHLWVSNKGSVSVTLSGGVDTINGMTTQLLPKKSTYHLHYTDEWRAI